MKSLLIALLLASASARATINAPNDLFNCSVAAKATDTKNFMFVFGQASSASSTATSKAISKNEMIANFEKQLNASVSTSGLIFRKPLIIDGNTNGLNAQIDASLNINFSQNISYALEDNPAIKNIMFADQNSQIQVEAMAYSKLDASMPSALAEADAVNDIILKQIAQNTNAATTNLPKIFTEISFNEQNSKIPFMQVKLNNKDGSALTSVELRSLTGSISIIKIDGLSSIVYTFHADLGLSNNFNSKKLTPSFDDYGFDISGIWVSGSGSQDAGTIKNLQMLGDKVCSNYHFHLAPVSPTKTTTNKLN